MSERPDQEERAGENGDAESALSELDALRDAGDIEGLLRLARAHRTGDGAEKDLRACFRAYEVAASLGDPEAHNAMALFFMAGGVVPQDMKEGVSHLRAAADGGHVAARVYLANLYELGVHYGKDASKADVWYRAVARGASLEPDSPDFDRAMANLGSVRHLLKLRSEGALAEADDQALTRKAMQLGLRLATKRDSDPGDRVSVFGDASQPLASRSPTDPGKKSQSEIEPKTAEKLKALEANVKPVAKKNASSLTFKAGLVGFLYTLLFFAFAAGVGHALTQGAHVLLQTRAALPVFGTKTHLILPATLVLFGVLPTFLVYRGATVFKALLVSVVGFFVGFALWGTGSGAFLADRIQESGAGAVAGFLSALFALGVLGGTKKTDPNAKI